ncbi:lipase member H [Phlebotomus argentipes]|uniref:lipase member H n=1 Tax=Phlebotomus argentipes TaxID=94469 RepID=UPI00289338F2|nr:lipase member H [Phlebotomus argentipes]
MLRLRFVFVAVATYMALANGLVFECPYSIQSYNNEELLRCLQDGWERFCEADVDTTVLNYYPSVALRDVKILLFGKEHVHTYHFADLCDLCSNPDFHQGQKTVVFVSGFPPSEDYSSVSLLWQLRQTYHDCNLIAVDLATCVEQTYSSLNANYDHLATSVAKLVHYLVDHSYVLVQDLYLVGFSIGAQVASHAAAMLRDDCDLLLYQLLLLDPSLTCDGVNYINKDLAKKVTALHTNSGHYGEADVDVHVQLFPNGKVRLQPCCKSNVCSHYLSVELLVEALCYPNRLLFVNCKDWSAFQKGKCNYKDVVALDLDVPSTAEGLYFCVTTEHSPYGLGNAGLKPVK